MKESETKKVVKFIAEIGMLKNLRRSGWAVVGVKNGESVAEHSFRAAVIGYIITN